MAASVMTSYLNFDPKLKLGVNNEMLGNLTKNFQT